MRISNLLSTLFIICLLSVTFSSCQETESFQSGKIYVSPDGDDSNPGTKESPLATPFGAKQMVAFKKMQQTLPEGGIEVIFRGGTYFLDQPLQFTSDDSGEASKPISYTNYENEEVIFSGGKKITGWENTEPGIWKVKIPEVENGEWYFRQLFGNGKRLTRAKTPNTGYYTTVGPLKKYKDKIKPWDFVKRSMLFREDIEAFCGFSFNPNELDFIPEDLENVEVLTHHSWESSWQSVREIDATNNEIHFNTPSWCPIGFFGDEGIHARYRLENYFAALDEPGEWYLNKKTGELYYMAKPGEKAPSMEIIAPALDNIITIEGIIPNDPLVSNITFSGIRFEHTAAPMGVYVNSEHLKDEEDDTKINETPFYLVQWPEHATKQGLDWPTEFIPGFMEPQAALSAGQAILINEATNVTFENCTIAHIGGYGINIGSKSHSIKIINNEITDAGSGGIRMGLWVKDVKLRQISSDDVPHSNIISGNVIRYIGKMHPGAVGIWLAQTKDNTVSHNELSNMPYSGISLGWTWNSKDNFTMNNTISNNHIHHVLQTLTDGGGIYTLGKMSGCVLAGNYIHDIKRAEGAIGSHSNGIFFDQASQLVKVKGNLIHSIGNEPIRFNVTSEENMEWEGNVFDLLPDDKKFPKQIAVKAGPQKTGT